MKLQNQVSVNIPQIAHVVDSTHIGGAERMAINYVNDLQLSGRVIPHLLVTRAHGLGRQLVLPAVAMQVFGKNSAFDIRALLRFIRYIRKHNIRCLHAHSTSIFWGLIAKKAVPDLRLIWHDHLGSRGTASDKFVRLAHLFGGQIDAYIGVTDTGVAWAKHHIPNQQLKTLLLENYPVLPKPRPLVERRFQKTAGTIVFLTLGNFRPEKNQLGLLQSFKRVLLSLPNARLWLAGKPIDLEYHRQVHATITALGLSETVTDWGVCQDVADIIDSADIAVIPSDFEGLPVALLEYALLKKSVIATAVGRIPEILGEGRRGMVVPPKNGEALADAMISLAGNTKLAESLAIALQSYVAEYFSGEVALKKLERLYTDLN